MQLDIFTLMAMESFVAGCAGAVLLFAWTQNRQTSALALWGLSNIGNAGGLFALMMGASLAQPILSIIGGNLLVLAQGIAWKAARTIDGNPAPLAPVLVGVVFLVLSGAAPALRDVAGSLGLTLSSTYLFAAAASMWRGSIKERLPARRPIIAFTSVHATFLMIGAISTLAGSADQNQVPALISLFGLVHFESIIYALGSAVFILALVHERSEAVSRKVADIDALTGIANRGAFTKAAERILERCRRDSAPVAMMMFDLDRFKLVNDTYGHAVGDAVLRTFCEVVSAALRPTDVFGWIGGEEFAVALPGLSIETAYIRAERIRISFSDKGRFVEGRQINATVSGGVSVSGDAEYSLSALLEHSDDALYRAKAAGRNCIKRAEQADPSGGQSTVIRVA